MSEEQKQIAIEILKNADKLTANGLKNVESYIRGYADAMAEKEEKEDAGAENQ